MCVISSFYNRRTAGCHSAHIHTYICVRMWTQVQQLRQAKGANKVKWIFKRGEKSQSRGHAMPHKMVGECKTTSSHQLRLHVTFWITLTSVCTSYIYMYIIACLYMHILLYLCKYLWDCSCATKMYSTSA